MGEKDREAVRARNLAAEAEQSGTRRIVLLEQEWGKYKYAVLERSVKIYQSIRNLLKDKDSYPVREFYRLIDLAYATDPTPQARANAAAHVWGYVKDLATEAEKTRYRAAMSDYLDGEIPIGAVKAFLWTMAVRYDVGYLRDSHYFK